MNSIFKLILFNLLSVMTTFGTPLCMSGQETQGQIVSHPLSISDVPCIPASVGHADCRICGSCKKSVSYLIGIEKVIWSQAYVLCRQAGMELASISSLQEEIALENYTKTITDKVGPYEGYWLAGTRHGSYGSDFVWFTTGKPVIYRKFSQGQPDNAGGTEACLELFLNGPDIFAWNDIPCDQKLGYICQSLG